MKQYCQTNPELRASNVAVRMVFNDIDPQNIDQLQDAIQQVACSQDCCRIEYSAQPFQDALQKHLPDIAERSSANLIIMDQCGVKEVTPQVIRQLAECSTTDILFFISSSFILRFIDTPELGGKFDMEADEVKTVDYRAIHRYVCRYFREALRDQEYYLSPFSIKKGSNIYGLVFGTSNLLGLEKFLTVCWNLDPVTGEANYNIDGDFAWAEEALFSELNEIRKVDLFKQKLLEFIAKDSPDNRRLCRFCLTNGFSPKKAGEILKSLQADERLTVTEIETEKPARRGAFYISYNNYKIDSPRVRFTVRDAQ